MSRLFSVIAQLSNEDIMIAWSKKEKHAIHYVKNTLHNSPFVQIHSFDGSLQDIYDAPFDVDKETILDSEIIKDYGVYLTKLEWEILDNDFDMYLLQLEESVKIFQDLYPILNPGNQRALKNIFSDISKSNENNALYRNYIRHHDFINHDGDYEKILERLHIQQAYTQMRNTDRTLKDIIGK